LLELASFDDFTARGSFGKVNQSGGGGCPDLVEVFL